MITINTANVFNGFHVFVTMKCDRCDLALTSGARVDDSYDEDLLRKSIGYLCLALGWYVDGLDGPGHVCLPCQMLRKRGSQS